MTIEEWKLLREVLADAYDSKMNTSWYKDAWKARVIVQREIILRTMDVTKSKEDDVNLDLIEENDNG